MRANQTDQMCNPHSSRESFAADVTQSQHQAFAGFLNAEKISRQVAHSEDLTRNIDIAAPHNTRRAQTSMHLRGFEDRSVQLRVILLQCFELLS